MTQDKITYQMINGSYSQAYVDLSTREGTDKHTDAPVSVIWMMGLDEWWEVPRGCNELQYLKHEYEPFVRVQPKKQTRKQRRSKKKEI